MMGTAREEEERQVNITRCLAVVAKIYTYMVRCAGRGCPESFVEGHDRLSSSGSVDSNTGGDLS